MRRGGDAGGHRKFLLDFATQLVNTLAHLAIDLPEFPLHHPERSVVSAAQLVHVARKTFANPRVGIILVAPPAVEHGLAHAIEARPIMFEVAPKRPVEKLL